MPQIKTLAPTVMDALHAVEQGCRKIQNDPAFIPAMQEWLHIARTFCWGCLATTTIMQLTQRSAKDIAVLHATTGKPHILELEDRATIFDIEKNEIGSYADFGYFELAINRLRRGNLQPLLNYYQLENHPAYEKAIEWYTQSGAPIIERDQKEVMLHFADFLKTICIPQLQKWFI